MIHVPVETGIFGYKFNFKVGTKRGTNAVIATFN